MFKRNAVWCLTNRPNVMYLFYFTSFSVLRRALVRRFPLETVCDSALNRCVCAQTCEGKSRSVYRVLSDFQKLFSSAICKSIGNSIIHLVAFDNRVWTESRKVQRGAGIVGISSVWRPVNKERKCVWVLCPCCDKKLPFSQGLLGKKKRTHSSWNTAINQMAL